MIKALLVGATMFAGLFFATPAVASQSPLTYVAADCSKNAGLVENFLWLKSWDACLTKDARGVPQITRLSDFWLIILPILEDALKVAGYAAAGFVTWGGIKYIKSQGDPGQINEARQVIYNALFGLLLAMISVAIVNFVAGAF